MTEANIGPGMVSGKQDTVADLRIVVSNHVVHNLLSSGEQESQASIVLVLQREEHVAELKETCVYIPVSSDQSVPSSKLLHLGSCQGDSFKLP